MKTIMRLAVLAVLLAGCSGRTAFEKEILGTPPESPPPATAAGSNIGQASPAERDLGVPPPEAVPPPQTGAPQPSVSTTSGEPLPPYAPAPYQTQPAHPAQPTPVYPSPAQTPVQTHSPYSQAVQTGTPGSGLLTFQVGSFAHEANAVSLRDVLTARGHQSSIDQGQTPQGKVFYRVYAKMAGTEPEARAALAALGVSDPTLVSGDPKRISPPPATAAPAAPAAKPATPPTPPVAPSSVQTAAPAAAATTPSVISGPTGQCHVDAERIATTGTSRADTGEPLMAQKAAAQNAKRNLLLCVDAYKRKAEKIPNSIKMEGYLPDTLVTYTSPAYLADGSVEVGASMAVGDVDAVAFTRLE